MLRSRHKIQKHKLIEQNRLPRNNPTYYSPEKHKKNIEYKQYLNKRFVYSWKLDIRMLGFEI